MQEAESKQQVANVVMISVISAILMAITIYGMIKLIKYFSPNREIPVPDPKPKPDGNTSQISQYDNQYDANKEFTEMYDTEHKFKNNTQEPELNLEMANTINILRQ